MLNLKAFGIWLVILLGAVANGALREAVLIPALGPPWALLVSGLILSVVVLAVAIALVPRLGRLDPATGLYVGLLWVVGTLVFEFGFGRLVRGAGWTELLEAYTFENGNIWPLVLVVIAIAPLVAMRLRGRP